MYSIYQIFQSEKLVYSSYHTMSNDYSDTTKLDIILNTPVTPYYLVDAYFKDPSVFTIKLVKSGISNALEASELLNNKAINTAIKKTKPRKPRTKKLVIEPK